MKSAAKLYVRLYIPVEMIGENYVSRISSFCIYGTGVSENEQNYDLHKLSDKQDNWLIKQKGVTKWCKFCCWIE